MAIFDDILKKLNLKKEEKTVSKVVLPEEFVKDQSKPIGELEKMNMNTNPLLNIGRIDSIPMPKKSAEVEFPKMISKEDNDEKVENNKQPMFIFNKEILNKNLDNLKFKGDSILSSKITDQKINSLQGKLDNISMTKKDTTSFLNQKVDEKQILKEEKNVVEKQKEVTVPQKKEHLLEIKRIYRDPEYTIGKVYLDGKYLCDCLEDADRDVNKNGKFDPEESKVWGKTAIPNGDYFVEWRISPHFSKMYNNDVMPYVGGLTTHKYVLFHNGNTPDHTLGCILLGKNTIKGKVTNSVETVKMFLSVLRPLKNDYIKIKIS